MLLIAGTQHSGVPFLKPILRAAGLRRLPWKWARQAGTLPEHSMVHLPISALKRFGTRQDRVVAMVRPWRAYCAEQEPGALPAEVTWWFQNQTLLKCLARRGSPFLLVGHDRLLRHPDATARRILRFVGVDPRGLALDLHPACEPTPLRHESRVLSLEQQAAFDHLSDLVEQERPITRADLLRFNAVNAELRQRFPRARQITSLRLGSARAASAK